MGHATLWPVPRAVDAEAHHYPRFWKRNLVFLYSSAMLTVLQLNRYGWICRVSTASYYCHLNFYPLAIFNQEW